jgi:hypothetical protein
MSLELIQEAAVKAGAPRKSVLAAIGAATSQGISLTTLLSLVLQFIQFGPQVWQIIADVIGAMKGPGGFNWAAFQELIVKDGPAAIALIQQIAALLHVTIPAPPTLPGSSAN